MSPNENGKTGRKESAAFSEELEAHFEELRVASRGKKKVTYPDPLEPPWIVMPGEPMQSMAWKMGSGEDYALMFRKWFRSLSTDDKDAYTAKYPEPKEWTGFYDYLVTPEE